MGARAEQPPDCVSRLTVSEYLRRTAEAGLSWPLPADLDEAHLEQLLFPPPPDLPAQAKGIPDWQHIHDELTGKNVTLFLLWQEYRVANPDGLSVQPVLRALPGLAGKLDLVISQDHRAGEKLFVDYAGQTVPIIDRTTGEIHEAQVFVAVMGASNGGSDRSIASSCNTGWGTGRCTPPTATVW